MALSPVGRAWELVLELELGLVLGLEPGLVPEPERVRGQESVSVEGTGSRQVVLGMRLAWVGLVAGPTCQPR